jgi:flagellar basal-body rod modification protein FlgD
MGSSPVTGTPPASTQFPGSDTSSSTASNQLNGNSFITLLTAQLKAQSPLNPMDPTQMVDQLAQINSLQQLIQIQGDMQTLISAVAPGAQTSGTGSGTGTGTGA